MYSLTWRQFIDLLVGKRKRIAVEDKARRAHTRLRQLTWKTNNARRNDVTVPTVLRRLHLTTDKINVIEYEMHLETYYSARAGLRAWIKVQKRLFMGGLQRRIYYSGQYWHMSCCRQILRARRFEIDVFQNYYGPKIMDAIMI
jgi:hypothetical protein